MKFFNTVGNVVSSLVLLAFLKIFVFFKLLIVSIILLFLTSVFELYFYNLEENVFLEDLEGEEIILLRQDGIFVRCDYTSYKNSLMCFTGNEFIKIFP